MDQVVRGGSVAAGVAKEPRGETTALAPLPGLGEHRQAPGASYEFEVGAVSHRRALAPKLPPPGLLLSVELAEEGNRAFYARAVEVDVAVEADTPARALVDLGEAVGDWLEYLRDEEPSLAPGLEGQRRYVALLRFNPSTWFGHIR